MDLRRLRYGEWLAGIAGAATLAVMFLHWYKAGGTTVNAWQAFAVTDVLLALAAAMAVSLAVAAAFQRSAAMPQAIAAITVDVALFALLAVLIRFLNPPGEGVTRELGAYLGLAGTLALFAGAWRSMSDQRFPREVAPKVEVRPLPAPKPSSERPGE